MEIYYGVGLAMVLILLAILIYFGDEYLEEITSSIRKSDGIGMVLLVFGIVVVGMSLTWPFWISYGISNAVRTIEESR